MALTKQEFRLAVYEAMVAKSGVREQDSQAARERLARSSVAVADFLFDAVDWQWRIATPANSTTPPKYVFGPAD